MSLFATVVTYLMSVWAVFPGVEKFSFCPTSWTSESAWRCVVLILLLAYPYEFHVVVVMFYSRFGVVYAFFVCGRELVANFEVP